jgi:2-polyprenyl-3-methyl-5-hydroxy-6-metoxy-1,4-benzoquinol methylase
MKFKSILIITYGRSGSTLLQGILNTIDGCVIRGENHQFCYGLYQAYKSIVDVKSSEGRHKPDVTSPFFGAHLLDETVFLKHASLMVKSLLLADQVNSPEIVCYGFKEVRYANVSDSLHEYLDFLSMIFPKAAFIFNTRNLDDVLKSGWWKDRDPNESRSKLQNLETVFADYHAMHDNSFCITYEDVINKTTKFKALFEFLGAPYPAAERMDKVFSTLYSYDPTQERIQNLSKAENDARTASKVSMERTLIQSKQALEDWYSTPDPWHYDQNKDDLIRKTRVLASIPQLNYQTALDIGCGNGFLTNDLPGQQVFGADISEKAIEWARQKAPPHIKYLCASIFDISTAELPPMDLIVITGVLYAQYIGESKQLIYILIDRLLKPGGILVCSHIYEWYKLRFPYLTVSREYFRYREYSQVLEVYCK